MIGDNVFDNFRYDLPKEKDSTYVIGINICAVDGAVIANNRFTAKVERGTGKELQMETVFVLFSAEVTKNCLVTQNQMSANEVFVGATACGWRRTPKPRSSITAFRS